LRAGFAGAEFLEVLDIGATCVETWDPVVLVTTGDGSEADRAEDSETGEATEVVRTAVEASVEVVVLVETAGGSLRAEETFQDSSSR
jgi:hypothetical protein